MLHLALLCSRLGNFSTNLPLVFVYIFQVIIIIHSFYIALFSALKQTHCAHVTCDSE